MASPIVHTTGHNASGEAVFIENPQYKRLNPQVGVVYAALANGAIDTSSGADIRAFENHDPATAGLIPKEGAVVLVAEWPPGANSAATIHRTLSVDVGVVIQGEVECHLDSGEKRLIRSGEVLIHRGTKHYWVNPSKDVTARMLCFVLPSKPVAEVRD